MRSVLSHHRACTLSTLDEEVSGPRASNATSVDHRQGNCALIGGSGRAILRAANAAKLPCPVYCIVKRPHEWVRPLRHAGRTFSPSDWPERQKPVSTKSSRSSPKTPGGKYLISPPPAAALKSSILSFVLQSLKFSHQRLPHRRLAAMRLCRNHSKNHRSKRQQRPVSPQIQHRHLTSLSPFIIYR